MAFGDYKFHGSFTEEQKARRRANEVKGAFIIKATVKGKQRWTVATKKAGAK